MVTLEKEKSIFKFDRATIELVVVVAIVIGSLLFVAIVYLTQFFPEEEGGLLFTDIVPVFFALGAVVASFFVSLKIYGQKTLNGKIWLYIAIGTLFGAIGEFTWFYYEIILEIDPYPSIADVAWIISYPILTLAFVKANQLIKTKLSKEMLILFAVISGICVVAIFLIVVLPIATFPVGEDFSMAEKVVSILYPVLDIFLFLFAFLLLLRFKGAKISFAWFLLAVSHLMDVFTDSWFSYLDWEEIYFTYHPVDLLWIVSYALIVIAAYYLRYASNRKQLMRL
ncbi:MAG: hypothetical protein ACFFCD_17430 [Promethearchaeota archaeon]